MRILSEISYDNVLTKKNQASVVPFPLNNLYLTFYNLFFGINTILRFAEIDILKLKESLLRQKMVNIVVKIYTDRIPFPHRLNFSIYFYDKDNNIRPAFLQISSDTLSYKGQLLTNGGDCDQYANYYGFQVQRSSFIPIGCIINPINNLNYFNTIITFPKDSFYPVSDPTADYTFQYDLSKKPIENPFLNGNPHPNCYQKDDESYVSYSVFHETPQESPVRFPVFPLINGIKNNDSGQLFFFRSDKQSSTFFLGEDVSPDGCLDTYLFASLLAGSGSHECPDSLDMNYFIMRVKIPNCYISDAPCDPTNEYDLLYFSISSMQASDICFVPNDYLYSEDMPFWTVNARDMRLNTYDINGNFDPSSEYCYIFFAPFEYVYSKKISPRNRSAPVIQWGNYKGPLLCMPTLAIYLRQKGVNKDWIGYAGNAPCYDTPQENKPIPNGSLGGYVPELFGAYFDTSSDFESATNIGDVNKYQPWPIS